MEDTYNFFILLKQIKGFRNVTNNQKEFKQPKVIQVQASKALVILYYIFNTIEKAHYSKQNIINRSKKEQIYFSQYILNALQDDFRNNLLVFLSNIRKFIILYQLDTIFILTSSYYTFTKVSRQTNIFISYFTIYRVSQDILSRPRLKRSLYIYYLEGNL